MSVDTDTAGITLAFSLAAIDRLADPSAVFADATAWSRSIGIVDGDTELIQEIVTEYDLRQDYDVEGRDKWFVLEEICETTETPRHVYIGASDEDMRVSTLFCWEYVRVTEAADKAGWTLTEPQAAGGLIARLLAPVRSVLE
jgi:hypothetical protein